jgi:hypothetical protein
MEKAKPAAYVCFALATTAGYGLVVSLMDKVAAISLAPVMALGLGACRKESLQPQPNLPVSTNAAVHAHTNRLAREKSPYLLQHQHNPVDWFAWGEPAFAKARAENKPIFLSIGYSTCHWCHVMERESFESEEVAKYLNEHFVSIKVDREERPDVDKIYMTFVQSTAGSGGWPLNCFLTPELKPFFGGTYFPPESRYGRPSFLQLLQQISQLWQTRHGDVTDSAAQLHAKLEEATSNQAATNLLLTPSVLTQAVSSFKRMYDERHGGFGDSPKFPQPSQPAFLLRQGVRAQDQDAVRMVLRTCDRMAAGGIHDQLGGGFSRYSVDAEWLVPHFEKMLYDNAQLVNLYLDAYLVSGEPRHADVARDIIAYVLRDMTHREGGFYSAEDADSEGKEGKFYCWTRAELSKLLTPEEFNVAVRYFGVTEKGNFVDHSDPNPLPDQNVLSVVEPKLAPADEPLLASAKKKMFDARAKRIRPHLDDKVLASWNGLMLGAMARAYAVLGDEAYRAAAEKNLAFLQAKLWVPPGSESRLQAVGGAKVSSGQTHPASGPAEAGTPNVKPFGTLFHRWRDGERDSVQLLEAYAFLLAGVIDLYEATLEPKHLDFALALAETMLTKFYDAENGGFWQSAAGAADLILRVKEDYDGAEPSGNSVATFALLKLGAITDRKDFKQAAGKTLRFFSHRLQNFPQAVPYMLQGLDFSMNEPKRAVIAGDPTKAETRALLRAVHSVYQPNKVVLGNVGAVEPFAKTLPAKDGPVVYLCTGTACQPPTKDAVKIKEMLR